MGAVYEAVDTRSDRKRALKVLLPSMLADEDVRSRFDREARLTGAIESDHLVEVSDAGVDPESNAPFIAMELLRGQDLETLLRQVGRAAPADVVSLLSQAALALDKTHAAGIVHRDLKPENLFVTRRENGTICLKVLDFGAAKKMASEGADRARPASWARRCTCRRSRRSVAPDWGPRSTCMRSATWRSCCSSARTTGERSSGRWMSCRS